MKFLLLFLLSFLGLLGGAQADNLALSQDLDAQALAGILMDAYKPHEGVPLGVPTSYDWAKQPRSGAGNDPHGFLAATGWGQVFYNQSSSTTSARITIRQFQTLVCTRTPSGMQWALRQDGAIEGRQFRADFSGNINQMALSFEQGPDQAEVGFERGTAFHFWPRQGRFTLDSQEVCGILVVLQARQAAGDPGSLLVGLGADYWASLTARWDNYKTNKDIAIGRLKVLGPEWRWIGMTTAPMDALNALRLQGYTPATNRP